MSIHNVSGLNGTYKPWQADNGNSIGQSFQNLSKALSSGNLTDAQSAFATISQNIQNTGGNYGNGSTQLSTAMQSLQSALQSGDTSGAQKALSTIQQSRRGHHRGSKGQDNQNSKPATTGAASSASQDTVQAFFEGLGNVQNALSSGNLSDANNAFSQLNSNSSALSSLTGNGQASQTLQALQGNIQAGDINSAQDSISTLIQNITASNNGNAIGNVIDVNS